MNERGGVATRRRGSEADEVDGTTLNNVKLLPEILRML